MGAGRCSSGREFHNIRGDAAARSPPPVHFNKLGDQEFEKVQIMKKATNATHILN